MDEYGELNYCYPGHECEHREAMRTVLGDEKYEFFFDKFLEYFFTEEDAKFFASLGLNCQRLLFNYRHLEAVLGVRYPKSRYYLGTLPAKTGQVPTCPSSKIQVLTWPILLRYSGTCAL
jgi:hypothetical protein